MVSSPCGRGKIATIAEVNRVRLSDDIYLEFLGEMWTFLLLPGDFRRFVLLYPAFCCSAFAEFYFWHSLFICRLLSDV
jgi:hypothetical protein